jgi:hypothetical protein
MGQKVAAMSISSAHGMPNSRRTSHDGNTEHPRQKTFASACLSDLLWHVADSGAVSNEFEMPARHLQRSIGENDRWLRTAQ